MIVGLVSSGFSEPLRVQLEHGIETRNIQCDNPNHVLVERANGKLACVSERTAEKMGLEIIEIGISPAPDLPRDQGTESQQESSEKIEEIIENSQPAGYWVPILEKDREDFAKKLVAATGDSLNGTVTENRYFTDVGVISFGENGVKYSFWEFFIEPSERKKFTGNFMDSMGFEYDDEDIKIHDNRSYTWYYYSHEYSYVTFTFAKFMDSFSIIFSGWTNHPESVIFHLSEEAAIQKAFEYIKNIEELYIPESEGGGCEAIIYESAKVLKYVKGGIPYYKIKVGTCTHSITYIIHADVGVYVHLDAETGDVISVTYPNYSHGPSKVR